MFRLPYQKAFVSSITALTTLFFSGQSYAGEMGPVNSIPYFYSSPWSVTPALGYIFYEQNNQSPVGRFAVDYRWHTTNLAEFGLELGVQNGQNLKLTDPRITCGGALPVQSTLSPALDLLITLTVLKIPETIPVHFIAKVGIAYQRMSFNDRTDVFDYTRVSPELQIGLSHPITERASVELLYQGIYGSKPNLRYNAFENSLRGSGTLNQQGLLFALNYKI